MSEENLRKEIYNVCSRKKEIKGWCQSHQRIVEVLFDKNSLLTTESFTLKGRRTISRKSRCINLSFLWHPRMLFFVKFFLEMYMKRPCLVKDSMLRFLGLVFSSLFPVSPSFSSGVLRFSCHWKTERRTNPPCLSLHRHPSFTLNTLLNCCSRNDALLSLIFLKRHLRWFQEFADKIDRMPVFLLKSKKFEKHVSLYRSCPFSVRVKRPVLYFPSSAFHQMRWWHKNHRKRGSPTNFFKFVRNSKERTPIFWCFLYLTDGLTFWILFRRTKRENMKWQAMTEPSEINVTLSKDCHSVSENECLFDQ